MRENNNTAFDLIQSLLNVYLVETANGFQIPLPLEKAEMYLVNTTDEGWVCYHCFNLRTSEDGLTDAQYFTLLGILFAYDIKYQLVNRTLKFNFNEN